MTFNELETVVLVRDLPSAGLRAGDLGAVVHVHGADLVECEFVRASGAAVAVVTLPSTSLRGVDSSDVLAVRPEVRGAA